MQTKLTQLIKDFSFVVLSNLLTLLTSSLTVLILPKVIGAVDYGYWQLYIFYVSYVGLFHLGWVDGIYLKFGGQRYNQLDRTYFYSELLTYSIFNLSLSLFVGFLSYYVLPAGNRQFIFFMLALNMVVLNARYMYIYILQATNRLRESSMILMSDRFFYIILVSFLLVVGSRDYKMMIFSDLVAKIGSLAYALFLCRDLVFQPLSSYRLQVRESWDNIKVGSNLMLSNIASMLIIGTIRMGIERRWDIATFGKVSLTLSISNLMMTFINAVGIVIFPRLKRAKSDSLPLVYERIRSILMPLLFSCLLLYFPLSYFLSLWLPAYRDSLIYMALVFPMSVYEGKMALLVNTYLKALRKERTLLRVNVMVTLLSSAFTLVTVFLMGSLELAVLSIVVLLAIRSSVAEFWVSRTLKLSILTEMISEAGLTGAFIFVGWFLPWQTALLIYSFIYLLYLNYKKKGIKEAVRSLKSI